MGPQALLWSAIAGRWVAPVALALLMRFADETHFESLFAATAMLSILGFLCLPLNLRPQGFIVFRVLTVGACFLAGKTMNLVMVSVAGHTNMRPLRLLAMGNMTVYIGHVSSILASTAITQALEGIPFSAWLYPVSAINIALLAIAGMGLLRDRNINGFLWQGAREEQGRGGSFAGLASSYGLTDREAEVFELLLTGRSVPFIAEALLISRATVKSHTNHIYQKCGVHNRQDLISLAYRPARQ